MLIGRKFQNIGSADHKVIILKIQFQNSDKIVENHSEIIKLSLNINLYTTISSIHK